MAEGMFDEAIVDVVGPDAIVSEPYVIKVRFHLPLGCIQPSDSHPTRIST